MKKIFNWLVVFSFYLAGCVTGQGTEVVIPTGNITTVYEPPTPSGVTFELVVAVLLIAMVLYLLIGKIWIRNSKKRQNKFSKKLTKKARSKK
ncbi:MAG: hypothetical protein Q8N14_05270 [Candidatus Omnitrophota bacterium]|nr:hypothetical protein [Candidatus Omnitrophota bacterium]